MKAVKEYTWTSDTPAWVRGISDVWEGLTSWRIWIALAREDFRARYKQTALGMLWILLSFALFILVKAVIFGQLSQDQNLSFPIFLCAGYLGWQFIQSSVTEGCRVFTGASNWIQGIRMPLSIFVFQSLSRNLIVFGYSSLVLVAVVIWQRPQLDWNALFFFAAVGVYILNLIWVELLLGSIATRYRDIDHLSQTIMRVMFFLTPIIWVPSSLGKIGQYVWYNPFTHYLEILRSPILNGDPAVSSWIVVGVVTAIGWISALWTFSAMRQNIPVWL